jgi:chaperone protein DnaJ
MVKDTKLYTVLGVNTDAASNDIKKAYRKLAMQWHPDKNIDNKTEAEEKFKEISEAYHILSDDKKRQTYDNFGMDGIKGDNMNFDPSDLFEQLFGGMGGGMGGGFPFANMFGGGGRQRQPKGPEDIMIKKEVSLEDIYCGKEIEVSFNQVSQCKSCHGSGSRSGKSSQCPGCNGRGMQTFMHQLGPGMMQQVQKPCDKCQGGGIYIPINDKCSTCTGAGLSNKDKTIRIPLRKGISHGQKIEIEGKGNESRTSKHKSNLVVIIMQTEHPIYQRNGNDLHMKMELRLFQALCGFTKTIDFFDGQKLVIIGDDIIEEGDIKCITEKGMSDLRTGMNGNLIIHFNVVFPKNIRTRLKDKNIELLRKILICDTEDTDEAKKDQVTFNLIKNDASINSNYELCELNDIAQTHGTHGTHGTFMNEETENNGAPECVQQ